MNWNDTEHPSAEIDAGHNNVSPNVKSFIRLIENFGFRINRQFDFYDRGMPNIGLVATKTEHSNHSAPMTYRISEHNIGRDITEIS